MPQQLTREEYYASPRHCPCGEVIGWLSFIRFDAKLCSRSCINAKRYGNLQFQPQTKVRRASRRLRVVQPAQPSESAFAVAMNRRGKMSADNPSNWSVRKLLRFFGCDLSRGKPERKVSFYERYTSR